MSSTRHRQQQPLQIYQDPESDRSYVPSGSTLPRLASPLRPIKNASSRRNIVLNAPAAQANNGSPHKNALHSSSSPSRSGMSNKLNMHAMPPPRGAMRSTDSLEKKQPLQARGQGSGPQKALFTTASNIYPAGKENYQHQYNDADDFYANDAIYGQKTQRKRALLEAPMIQSKKQRMMPEPTRPAAEQFGAVKDDGTKPSHSYATLIGMAILGAPGKRLTLAQIYKWISDSYSYYSAAETGWQNSIRHNLSLNKAFVKQERPKDDPGKGNYWVIAPGEEEKFNKDKQPKKGTIIESGPIMSASVSLPAPPMIQERPQSSYRNSTPAPSEFAPPSTNSFMSIKPATKMDNELSSDATIPASDTYQPDEEAPEHELYAHAGAAQPILSSPPALMQSSPPVPRRVRLRDDTPPPVVRFARSSAQRSHKRNFASMDDSGYFSSLNSSALRNPVPDRHPVKRGRAEEEIARLRGSSYDSPSKTSRRARHTPCAESIAWAAPSSSPLRRGLTYDSAAMLPPLTPAVKLTAPSRPPPSVSPTTNLRLHRERVRQLVGSPMRDSIHAADDCLPWSPAFNLAEPLFPDLETEFEMFIDATAGDFLAVPGNGSPEKRTAKRGRFDLAPSALGDLSSNGVNSFSRRSVTSTPKLNFTPSLVPRVFHSPSAALGLGGASPSKFASPIFSLGGSFDIGSVGGASSSVAGGVSAGASVVQEEYYGAEFLADGVAEDAGMDILQGFAKIGAKGRGGGVGEQMKGGVGVRSGVRRSFTSRF
ncbi:hypothetical protein V499_00193 [Pseudogymnoascus sp. VKM F-103]|uniref:Fork-head domain-containing protein n=1 Tax=Pseudogymnoascus verrucosus TaxID=342668 RepID=A0A1B8GNL5_9PEZI|nr:uncharacterized protein VE01_04289 [Pseudogymnoascus verrucosus]KFY81016.1 hypothetical protein V499_00193 [Pseudogymnoascus sp. VKM F-103]OBT97439.1 hypothetical protein VE01_04289 [Pseudogymnoascus verrucosus]